MKPAAANYEPQLIKRIGWQSGKKLNNFKATMENSTILLKVGIYKAARDGKIWFSLGKLLQLS